MSETLIDMYYSSEEGPIQFEGVKVSTQSPKG